MLGCEIIELAQEGDVIMWSRAYATKVCEQHGVQLLDYMVERYSDACDRVPAADLLGWLGY